MNYEGWTPLYPKHVLCAQEIYGWLESRLGHDKTVLLLGYFVFYSGKMGISIIYDAQLNSSADKRLKFNVSKRFECEKLDDNAPYFKYWELDTTKTEENIRLNKKPIKLSKPWLKKYVFPFYNTYKVSKPVGFDKWLETIDL